ncbi:FAD-dependent oxidoreductase [Salinispirillum sp. LH 10-3-1]|uniref:Tryptophan 2-monooxygenase n=1 Tax=Salinispirillum sp. LH 10-3-1 TaxID=2952525 RepID=A0AB38YJ23_9GAMM
MHISMRPTHSVVSDWNSNPLFGGVYSFLRPQGTPDDRQRLAQEILPNLWLAGEYNWADGPGTLHGAVFSGERAAHNVLAQGNAAQQVIVIGAGLAGLSAAQLLSQQGYAVTVLEASPFVGGRARSDSSMGVSVPLGGAWLHGHQSHPLASDVSHVAWPNWQPVNTFLVDHGQISNACVERVSALLARLESHWNTQTGLSLSVAEARQRSAEENALKPENAADQHVLDGWIRFAYSSLISAPLHELSVEHREEPYFLTGQNHLITGGLPDAIARRAAGLDIKLNQQVLALEKSASQWAVRTRDGQTLLADHVICATPVTALRDERLHVSPSLPSDVQRCLSNIGFGKVAKTFFRFPERCWGDRLGFLITGPTAPPYETFVDMTQVTGSPTLCAFSTGENALRAEQRSPEDRLNVVSELLIRAQVR